MRAVAAFLLALGAVTQVARADGPAAAAPPVASSVDASASAELDAWLGRLASPDAAVRAGAVQAIDSATAAMLPAIAGRLSELKRSANREAMGSLLLRV